MVEKEETTTIAIFKSDNDYLNSIMSRKERTRDRIRKMLNDIRENE